MISIEYTADEMKAALASETKPYMLEKAKKKPHGLDGRPKRDFSKMRAEQNDLINGYNASLPNGGDVVNENIAAASAADFQFEHVKTTKNGTYPMKVWQNTQQALEHLGYFMKYDEIARSAYVKDKNGQWVKPNDNFTTEMQSEFQFLGYALGTETLDKHLNLIASKHSFNLVADYLDSLTADGDHGSEYQRDRAEFLRLLSALETDGTDLEAYKYDVMKCQFVNWVRMAYNDEFRRYNIDGFVVFQGGQGIGKTELIKRLLPDGLEKYFKESVYVDPTDKDTVISFNSYWIVEYGEFDGMTKKDQSRLKHFVTSVFDVLREPFGRKARDYYRKVAPYGTVNEIEYLTDKTGNRRYWTIPLKSIDHDIVNSIEKDRIWRFAVAESLKLDSHKLNPESKALLNELNECSTVKNVMESRLDTRFKWDAHPASWKTYTGSQIQEILDLKTSKGLQTAISKKPGTYKKRTEKGVQYLLPPVTWEAPERQ